MPKKLTFPVPYFSIDEPTPELIASHIGDDSPRFSVTMMLAKLDVPNANGHRLTKAEVEKAIAKMDDPPLVPGNLDHLTMPLGAGYEFWVEEKGRTVPELWMSAVYWKRYISEDKRKEIEAARASKKLGASWEIDEDHYVLEADKDDPKILDIKDFSIDGFGLMVEKTPAEISTRGTATISAQRLDGGHSVVDVSTYDELPTDMLRRIRCSECGSRGKIQKADFVNGIFEMECLNAAYDSDKISHIYEVTIVVKPKGQAAEYRVTATKEAAEAINSGVESDTIKTILKNTKEVCDMTDEDKKEIGELVATHVATQMEAIRAAQKKADEDLAKQNADMEAEIERRVKEGIAKAGVDAVEAYKKEQAVTAKRFDELNEILPYKTEAEKVAECDKISAMTDERFTEYKEKRELVAKIARLEEESETERIDELAEILAFESEEAKAAEREKIVAMTDEEFTAHKEARELLKSAGTGLPAGVINAGTHEGDYDAGAALGRL
jgi:hypothetical protein